MVCGLRRGRRDPAREVGGDRSEDGVGKGRGDTVSQAGAPTLLLQQKTIDGGRERGLQGHCRVANSYRPGHIVGVLRIICSGVCSAKRFHNERDDQECRMVCLEQPDGVEHSSACL